MGNLQFLTNVTHNGVIFKGPQIKDNKLVAEGMVVDLSKDTRGLSEVANDLIERGLARTTTEPATHSSVLVNNAQEAIPVDAPQGSAEAPASDPINSSNPVKTDEQKAAEKAKLDEQNPPPPSTPPPAGGQASKPASGQPTADQISAEADSVT